MPRIKRWFPVSHDINRDPEVWELTDKFGASGLRCWLEMLSIADRNEGIVAKALDQTIVRALSIASNSTQRHVIGILQFTQSRLWISSELPLRVLNHWKYHRSEERKPLPPDPTEPTGPNKNKNKNKKEERRDIFSPWPDEDLWLKNLLESPQNPLAAANGYFLDYRWWEELVKVINGIDQKFMATQFAKIGLWLKENPQRMPTAKGSRRFLRTWLERAKEDQRRRVYVAK